MKKLTGMDIAVIAFVVLVLAGGLLKTLGIKAPEDTSNQSAKSQPAAASDIPATQSAQEPVAETKTPDPISIEPLMGKKMADLAAQYGVSLNAAGNMVWENDSYRLVVEPKTDFVADSSGIKKAKTLDTSGFAGLTVKWTDKCGANENVSSHADVALRAAGIDPSKAGSVTNKSEGAAVGGSLFTYGSYQGDWSLTVGCDYNAAPTVSLGSKS